MIIQIKDDFNIGKIADSGQCFRWEKPDLNKNSCRIIAADKCLYLTLTDRQEGFYELDCSPEEYDSFWHNYFDLDEDYRSIRKRIDPSSDPFLFQAAEEEQGIRILRQDPWEMLISFIISQNRNIPAIKRSIEMISELCGERKADRRGEIYYAFPDASALAALSDEQLKACRLGYRCKYVQAAARAVEDGELCLNELAALDEDDAMAVLTGLFGVGVKVASCVSLFGLHHLDAFPVDVWMKRILADHYPDGYPYEEYSPYNGICQQYMFAFCRRRAAEERQTGGRKTR